MQPWEYTARAVKTAMEAMMIPERSEATEDRAFRLDCGEPEKCIDCREADTCEDVGGWCYKDDAEQARWESKLDEMRGK